MNQSIIVINDTVVFYPIQGTECFLLGNSKGLLNSSLIKFTLKDTEGGKKYDSIEEYLLEDQVFSPASGPEITLRVRTVDKGRGKIWLENAHGERLTVNYYSLHTLHKSQEYKEIKEFQKTLINLK